ncbi:MAG: lysozyme family protein [Clostridium sp.]|nr:lysozyme family protein [Clostridium sp.]
MQNKRRGASPKRSNIRRKKKKRILWGRVFALLAAFCLIVAAAGVFVYSCWEKKNSTFPEEVLAHRPMVEEYAEAYGISEYNDWLMAILAVESGGIGDDVMQSSESLGKKPNSLGTEESIEQGCSYFKELLGISEGKNVDFDSILQAYNYGPGYLDYVAKNGGKHSQALAEAYALEKSGGVKELYPNPVAIKANGGWRYKYGNMFYVPLVKLYEAGEFWALEEDEAEELEETEEEEA